MPDRGFVPLGDEDDEASGIPLILDTGAFKRVVTPARFKAIRQEEGATTVEALERLRFDRLSECYSFVLVEPSKRDEEVSTARLWYWNREADGTWEMSTRCES